ncbi:capon-like protein isoform X8 [Phlebotomus papatasi]|uniref:capon-like protein isoform X8 n=1 Tax=Phlebotomus papatasi TaxID=29031 RepID=UPI0024840D36|nr:capon-like protein isoform X8 [Phlebotomus papatasi]XP_055703282.1 capon-like protein isoform X8 [Phlebotomus papatasi]XP_055703284.1 capon-like protein isoform X8 [Phlebotomus papatasi]XP_055703285.1 capon-like protein isoform X8 [Phlebotomus papatasi]XP_055703286.1 capon-like protein isoform X8 [Phlebotomus papatasi]XP_055703287.1 capon-like protein isoform X8 [Phlebotomus papatasi]XP_055703288.1 capon-like protein isoform X8 [Phlebotomus papatasi]
MPSTPYDLVSDDLDVRVPLYADQAFDHGITFQAKFIGWQEVPRPSSKTEIVQAMRRIRYECKVQNMKKRKVSIEVSVDGVRVCLKKKKRKKKQWNGDGNGLELMNHPIYRIFYVSHDSSDLKIFSYIARDGSTDTFKCSVFKSHKKSQAMRIVRTVGQAFEVCHNRKVSAQNTKVTALDRAEDGGSETPCDTSEQDRCSDPLSDDEEPRKEIIPITPEPVLARPNHLDILSQVNYDSRKSPQENEERSTSPLPAAREIQKLKEQLEQQSLQTRQALAQLMLVREQLISETNARVEAQARTQQLLQQNRELLEHIAALGGYHEPDRPSLTAATLGIAPQLSSTAKVARWFSQLPWNQASLSRPESGFVSGDSRSEKNILGEDNLDAGGAKEPEFCDEYLLVEGTANLWAKLSAKKRRKLLGLRLGKVTTF